MEFTFKSSGRDIEEILADNADANIRSAAIPVGLMTPLRNSTTGNGIFEVHYSVADQVTDNLRNLIQTNHGERLGRPDYGANLRPLSLELMGQEGFESEAMGRIQTSVSKYLPFISLKTMRAKQHRDAETNMPQVIIRLEYDVKRMGTKRALEVVVNLAG